jgi:hypothetical protein
MKKTTWFAVFVVVLLGATYYFEFYQAGKDELRIGEDAKIVSFPPDQIHKIEIENKLGKVLLKRDAGGWQLEEPVKDWADNQFVEDFVNGLVSEKTIDIIDRGGEALNWSLYGLDRETGKDIARVTFTNQQESFILIEVSAKKNFEGNSFLHRGSENKVLVGTSQWVLRSQKSLLDFRDKRLFRGKIGSVEGMTIKSQKGEFQLVNKDNRWISEKNPEIKLDQNKVREILTSLNEVHASDFLKKAPTHAVEKAKVSLKLKDKIWSVDIRQAADKSVVGVTSDPAFVLKLEPGQVDKFFDMTFLGLRDRKEPFDFQNLSVRRIEINTTLKKMVLTKGKENWSLESDNQAAIDQNAIRNFITRLSDSSVTEYLEKREWVGFKNPENKIVLKGEDGKILYDLSWGPTVKKKALIGEKTLILAQSNLFKDVFGLDSSVVESWGLMDILKKETP